MHPFHRSFCLFFCYFVIFFVCFFIFCFVPEVDKLWQTSHLNLIGLESRQAFLPSICSTCDVSTQHQTSESKVKNGKQIISGPFSQVVQNAQIFPMLGVLWSCVDMAPNHWELEKTESNKPKIK